MTTSGTVLWLLAHPDTASLSHALYRHGTHHLRASGAEVTGVDLHAENWNPVLGPADTDGAPGATLSDRQRHATLRGELPADVVRQQRLVLAADTVIVQFPLWWYGMPAILKGWFDRVFTNGFAFGVKDADGKVRKYGDGGLAGRRMLPIVTAGDRDVALGSRGISGDIDDVLWPLLHGTAHYTGMLPLRPHLIGSVHHLDEAGRDQQFRALEARLDGLGGESPIRYRSLRGGDYTDTHELRDGVEPGRHGLAVHRLAG
ncbi:NAD(P)H-dependent oxidoreductase [Nocardia sp. NPDC048505]|uniref:NAD(P)H-dependent oxidoreductase n=1 Tax=unclassified Nocardia TaxID=2637762 RepID=UPI0034113D6D